MAVSSQETSEHQFSGRGGPRTLCVVRGPPRIASASSSQRALASAQRLPFRQRQFSLSIVQCWIRTSRQSQHLSKRDHDGQRRRVPASKGQTPEIRITQIIMKSFVKMRRSEWLFKRSLTTCNRYAGLVRSTGGGRWIAQSDQLTQRIFCFAKRQFRGRVHDGDDFTTHSSAHCKTLAVDRDDSVGFIEESHAYLLSQVLDAGPMKRVYRLWRQFAPA